MPAFADDEEGDSEAAQEEPAAKPKKGQVQHATYRMAAPSFYPPMLHPIRVGIHRQEPWARFAVWTPGAVVVDGRPVCALKPQTVYNVTPSGITELATGHSIPLPRDRRTYITSPDFRVWTNKGWWRGCLEIVVVNGKLNVINLLDLEDYLLGCVPAEMPPSWHLEALKSQAVAARSYAWAHMGPSKSKWYKSTGYDLVPDVRDQMYKGLAAEQPSTFRAVRETRGIVLKNSGVVKAGFYRATVGGSDKTSDTNLNIRKHVVSNKKLEAVTGISNILGVTVRQWDPRGFATAIQIMGQGNSRDVNGLAMARMLGLTTAGLLDVSQNGENWIFTCRGPGNGSKGLSQHGANLFAKRGWRFDQILTQYYQDSSGKLQLDLLDHYRPEASAFPGN
ncbi:MAG: SpoIID/LytB domain-containing protein [Candidatus Melainabacteria bacterium]|nr:SpoIID/LytB domain-containing protein [Candidatus Melainabacteria bacterium]